MSDLDRLAAHITADRLALLAGQSEAAHALLNAARDGIADDDIDTLLAEWTVSTTYAADRDQRAMVLRSLEYAVDQWLAFDAGLPTSDWTSDEIDAEILHDLFVLITGQQPCWACLRGWLTDVDRLAAEGDCDTHRRAVA